METKYWVFLVVIAFLVGAFLIFGVFFPSPVGKVEVNLVNANSDLAGGKQAWEFKVNGKEIPAGSTVKVWSKFEIEVIEFASQKIVDKLDIASLIKKGDLIAYAYYGSASSQGESLYIHIQHKDGAIREVSVNINNNQ